MDGISDTVEMGTSRKILLLLVIGKAVWLMQCMIMIKYDNHMYCRHLYSQNYEYMAGIL